MDERRGERQAKGEMMKRVTRHVFTMRGRGSIDSRAAISDKRSLQISVSPRSNCYEILHTYEKKRNIEHERTSNTIELSIHLINRGKLFFEQIYLFNTWRLLKEMRRNDFDIMIFFLSLVFIKTFFFISLIIR